MSDESNTENPKKPDSGLTNLLLGLCLGVVGVKVWDELKTPPEVPDWDALGEDDKARLRAGMFDEITPEELLERATVSAAYRKGNR